MRAVGRRACSRRDDLRIVYLPSVPQLRPDTPVQFLKGIGEKRAEALARLGVHSAQDLLLHLPHRYLDASTVTPLAKARVGDDVACIGTVVSKGVLPTRKGLRIFHAVLKDAVAKGKVQFGWAWVWPYHVGTQKSHPPVGESRPPFSWRTKNEFLFGVNTVC